VSRYRLVQLEHAGDQEVVLEFYDDGLVCKGFKDREDQLLTTWFKKELHGVIATTEGVNHTTALLPSASDALSIALWPTRCTRQPQTSPGVRYRVVMKERWTKDTYGCYLPTLLPNGG